MPLKCVLSCLRNWRSFYKLIIKKIYVNEHEWTLDTFRILETLFYCWLFTSTGFEVRNAAYRTPYPCRKQNFTTTWITQHTHTHTQKAKVEQALCSTIPLSILLSLPIHYRLSVITLCCVDCCEVVASSGVTNQKPTTNFILLLIITRCSIIP